VLLSGDDAANAAFRVGDIGLSPGNEVHVAMEYGLACRLSRVHANVEACNRWVLGTYSGAKMVKQL
jgi:hypothetical protein